MTETSGGGCGGNLIDMLLESRARMTPQELQWVGVSGFSLHGLNSTGKVCLGFYCMPRIRGVGAKKFLLPIARRSREKGTLGLFFFDMDSKGTPVFCLHKLSECYCGSTGKAVVGQRCSFSLRWDFGNRRKGS